MLVSQVRVKEVLDYDPETGIFTWIRRTAKSANRVPVGSTAGGMDGRGYIRIKIDG